MIKNEVICFVNGQMGVYREQRRHFASNHNNQKVILVFSMFIIRARKLEVVKKVVSVEPELGKFSSPIKEKELYIFPLFEVAAQLLADYEQLEC